MADDSKRYDIEVATHYDGKGMDAARADMAQPLPTVGGGAVPRDAGAAAQQAKMSAEAAAAMKVTETETLAIESQKTIELEKQLIVSTRRAALEADIAGDKQGVAKLRAELAIRQLTIQVLQTEEMTQAQINALIAEQTVMIEQSAAAIAARAAAEEAEAANQHKLHGRAGHLGHLAENFGLDANSAIAMGMGLMFGLELKRLIEEQTKKLEEQNNVHNEIGAKTSEQVHSLREQLLVASSWGQVNKAREEAEKAINELQKKRTDATEEEKQFLDVQIGQYQTVIAQSLRVTQAQIDRVTHQQEIEDGIKREKEAFDTIVEAYKILAQESDKRLETELQIYSIGMDSKEKALEHDRAKGKISEEEYVTQKAALKEEAETHKFQEQEKSRQGKRADIDSQVEDLNGKAGEAQNKAIDAEAEANAAQAKKQEVAAAALAASKAAEAVEDAKKKRDETGIDIKTGTYVPTKAALAAKEALPELQAKAAAAQSVYYPLSKQSEKIDREAEEKNKAAELLKKAADEAQEKARKAALEGAKQKQELDLQSEDAKKVFDAQQKARAEQTSRDKGDAGEHDRDAKVSRERELRMKEIAAENSDKNTTPERKIELAQEKAKLEKEAAEAKYRNTYGAGDAAARAGKVADQEAAQEAQREADRQKKEDERKKKEWEKAHGPETQGEAMGAAQHAGELANKGFNSDKLVQQASAAMKQNPLEHGNQAALVDALQKLIAAMGMGDEARKKEAQALVAQIKAVEEKTAKLQQSIKEHSY